MIKIKTDDIELLKEVCESLAYDKIWSDNHNGRRYCVSDEEVANILKLEGLDVEIEKE